MELIDLKTELRIDVRNAFDSFNKQLLLFNENELNEQPSHGGWSAGQVADHVIKATNGLPDENTSKADRAYDYYVETLRNLFLDFSTKMNAPDFVRPEDGPFNKEHQLSVLSSIAQGNIKAIETKDLEELCLDFKTPNMGYLTRYEWLQFMVVHVLRHTNQLKTIYAAVHR